MMNTNFSLDGRFTRYLIASLMIASIWGCGSNDNKNGDGNPGVRSILVVDVPECTSADLNPFQGVGTAIKPSELPVGQYNYTGGEVYIETLNLTPQAKMHVLDDNANAQNYSGTMTCLTGIVPGFPSFTTGSYLYRFMNITGSAFNLAITRSLQITSDGTTITNVFNSDDQTVNMTNAQFIALENSYYNHGDQLAAYQTGANTYRLILIRISTKDGLTAKMHIAANYAKIQ